MSYYKYITDKREDSHELKSVMHAVTEDLKRTKTDDLKPGILLGLIQSGKTRAFVGVIAKCFDEGYDVAVIFTKNSVALAEQSIKRLKSDFSMPIDRNRLYVWDIIKLQEGLLTGYILDQKQIFVVKKESKNLIALERVFNNPVLQKKKVLIIDDEADQASVSFIADKDKEEGFDMAKVAGAISNFRHQLKGNNSYLQVTATPYSLYLQPEDMTINQTEYAPLRPAFTHLLHPHSAYIGGKYYFEYSLNSDHPASYIHVQVSEDELKFLNCKTKTTNTYNKKAIDNILNTSKLEKFRFSIYSFLVGGAIRQEQEKTEDFWAKPYHCAFILHTSQSTAIHQQQKNLVEEFIRVLSLLSEVELAELLKEPYTKLRESVLASNQIVPEFSIIVEAVSNALKNRHVGVVEVNSKTQIVELLGEDGQLRLDNPFNIFAGGQSLDRGITIDHLIGFYYGRSPLTFQMDTVLQHSRMYGNRSIADLAVTRFYTTAKVYEAMRNMHCFDQDLRADIEKDINNASARFIAKHGNTIIPAGPNKLKASSLQSFRALSRLLPKGFQTRSQTDIKGAIAKIDEFVSNMNLHDGNFGLLNKDTVFQIIDLIENTFIYEDRFDNKGLDWDVTPFKKALEIALEINKTTEVFIYAKDNREASRYKHGGDSFGDAPDDGKTDLPICKKQAAKGPVLMLLKQKGDETDGWRNAPFYWPVMIMPENMPNYVYCEI